METNIDYKRLYELSIIEKEQIITDNQKHLEKINELTKELNEYKIENYSKKTYYQKNKASHPLLIRWHFQDKQLFSTLPIPAF